MTPFKALMLVYANNPLYRGSECPFGEMYVADGTAQVWNWRESAESFRFIWACRDWCWSALCSSWIGVSHALIIGRE